MSVENDRVCEVCETFIEESDRLAATVIIQKPHATKGVVTFQALVCGPCGSSFRPVAKGPVNLHSAKSGQWIKPAWPSSYFEGEK